MSAAVGLALLTLVPGPHAHLRGSHFTPGSVVRIVESGSKTAIFKVRASSTGTFVLAVPTDHSKTWFVQAIGVRGERASFGLGAAYPGSADIGN